MKKISTTLFTLLLTAATVYSQSVVTFAGKANDDIYTKYESTSGAALTNTYFASPQAYVLTTTAKCIFRSRIR